MTSNNTIPELPFVDDFMAVAKSDLEASRSLVQRLLSLVDALLATTFTVTGLFAGLAFTNKSPAIAIAATPLIIVLAYIDGLNWAHFKRVSARVRSLERLFHAYVSVLRETKTVRPQALHEFRSHVDRYQFGIEQTLERVGPRGVWTVNRGRLRSWLYAFVAMILLIFGLLFVPDGEPNRSPVCVTDSAGGVAQFDGPPSPLSGSVTLVPCPTATVPATVPRSSQTTATAGPNG
jgi:hypothetical protein